MITLSFLSNRVSSPWLEPKSINCNFFAGLLKSTWGSPLWDSCWCWFVAIQSHGKSLKSMKTMVVVYQAGVISGKVLLSDASGEKLQWYHAWIHKHFASIKNFKPNFVAPFVVLSTLSNFHDKESIQTVSQALVVNS